MRKKNAHGVDPNVTGERFEIRLTATIGFPSLKTASSVALFLGTLISSFTEEFDLPALVRCETREYHEDDVGERGKATAARLIDPDAN